MKISKELKTGIIATIAIALLFWGLNFLKKQNLFEKERIYFSKFDNVQGLSNSSVVMLNGLQVGNVMDVRFDTKKKGSFIVKYNITKKIYFSDKSVAKIIPPTVMGSTLLAIIPDFSGENAASGTFLKGSVDQGLMASLTDKFNPLNEKLSSVMTNVDQLLVKLNATLDTNTQNNIKASIANLNASLKSFKNVSNNFDTMLVQNKEKFSNIMTNADEATKNFKNMASKIDNANLTDDLKQTITKLNTSLNSFDKILANIEKGEGSMGMLLKDKGLYNNLENASKEMEELLREMKLHPKRFVHFSLFGKKDKGYKKDTVK